MWKCGCASLQSRAVANPVYKVRDEARDTVLVALVKASVAEVRDLLGVRKHHLVNTLAGAVDDEGPDHVGQTRARGPPVAQTKVRRKAPTRKQPKAAFRAVATDPEETSEEAPESTSSSSVNIEAAPDSRDVVEPNDAAIDSDAPPPMSSTSIERFDAMSAYLREVQRHPLLTADDTRILAEQFVQTQRPELAARLVTSNLRLVVKIAYEYRRAYKNIMDLVQEGNIGLMQAVRRYDPSRGVKLSSYAAWWIRAYILRFILNNWRLVKLGTTQAQRKLFFNLRKKRAELVARGIDPTNAEIAKQLNVDESDVAEMDVRLTSAEGSLDAPIGDAEGRSIAKIDMMPAPAEGPEALLAGEELQALLKTKLQTFRETLVGKVKEIAIFDERLVSDEPLTLQELGTRFGISRERVRQLEHRLTGRLREFLQAEMGDATEIR